MNHYLLIVLFALIGEYLLQALTRLLTLRSMQENVPAPFADVYDAEEYRRAQQYARARGRFGLIESTIQIIAVVAFILLGGFPAVDHWVRSFGFGPILTGLLFFATIFLLGDLLSTPFDLYRTLVIEERFGFNKANLSSYLGDKLKGYAVTAMLGGVLLAAVLYFFGTLGSRAWLYAWLLAAFGIIVLPALFTTLIAPLFNRFEPLPEGELRSALAAFAERVGFPLRGIFVMDGSRRSTKSNAYFSGFGRSKRIVLFDTLIDNHPTSELVAILGHEIGHYQRGHILQGTAISILYTGVLFFAMSFFITEPRLFAAFGMNQVSVYAGLLFFTLLFSPLSQLLQIFMFMLSRRNEYQADQFAAENLGDPEPLIRGLKTLSVSNLANLTPHPLDVFLNYSHPTPLQRIERLGGGNGPLPEGGTP